MHFAWSWERNLCINLLILIQGWDLLTTIQWEVVLILHGMYCLILGFCSLLSLNFCSLHLMSSENYRKMQCPLNTNSAWKTGSLRQKGFDKYTPCKTTICLLGEGECEGTEPDDEVFWRTLGCIWLHEGNTYNIPYIFHIQYTYIYIYRIYTYIYPYTIYYNISYVSVGLLCKPNYLFTFISL